MKLNAPQKQAVQNAVKFGFTFSGDSFFKSFRSAKSTLSALVSNGYLIEEKDDYGGSFKPTQAARDFVTYGIEI